MHMLYDLVKKSRSYRGYDMSYKVTEAELKSLVDCARICPSAVNKQPLAYYLAWEENKVNLIQSLTKWAGGLPDLELPHKGKYPTAFIVILRDNEINASSHWSGVDLGIAAQTILLAATEKGLGGCMIGNFSPAKMSEALNLSDRYEPLLVLAIGKPDEEVVLVDVGEDGDTKYYRDEHDVHYVPKRKLEDIIY